MEIQDIIDALNNYLGLNLDQEQFLNHQFTGSEIAEALENEFMIM
jgi:hypothetical protein